MDYRAGLGNHEDVYNDCSRVLAQEPNFRRRCTVGFGAGANFPSFSNFIQLGDFGVGVSLISLFSLFRAVCLIPTGYFWPVLEGWRVPRNLQRRF